MALNFPSSPTDGQVFIPTHANGSGPIFIYNTAVGAWTRNSGTASTYNRVVNPAMQISQQNSNNAGTTNSYYPADQWLTTISTTGVVSHQRVQSTTPNGSINRLRFTVTTADTSIAAGELSCIYTMIEGNRIADFKFGVSPSERFVLRFGWKSPAGTYSIVIMNGTSNRSYVGNFTISAGQANTDTVQSFSIQADTTGTWSKDYNRGLMLYFTLATGTTYQGAANTWLAGLFLGSSSNTNGLGTVGNVFELFDVGLYLDPNATGVAPEFQAPDLEEDIQDCLRYWTKAFRFDGTAYTTTTGIAYHSNYVPMRIAPTGSVVGTLRTHDISVAPNATTVTNYQNHAESSAFVIASAGTYIIGRPFRTLVDGQTASYIALTARM